MEESSAQQRRAEEVLSRLKLRDEERKLKVQKDKQASSTDDDKSRQRAEEFLKSWRDRNESLSAQIEEIERQGDQDKQAAEKLKKLSTELTSLEEDAAKGSGFLTTFHNTQLTVAAKALRERLSSCQAAVKPRRRFTFSQAKAGLGSQAVEQPPPASQRTISPALAAILNKSAEPINSDRALKCQQGQQIVRRPPELDGKAFTLEDLTDCDVYLLGNLAALRAYELTNCRIFVTAVKAAAYLDGLKGCKLTLATGQLRVHNTQKTDFYLRVSSDPILEDCSGLRFAPLAMSHPVVDPILAAAGLLEDSGQWRAVKDFAHPSSDKSPNWDVIEEGNREQLTLPQDL